VILYSLEIPDKPDELAGWLTSQLLGPNLAPLVAELSAIRDSESTDHLTLDDVLAGDRSAVLSGGLSALPADRLQQLLQRPTLLLDLQEAVLTEGGTCWKPQKENLDESNQRLEFGWNRLQETIHDERPRAFDSGADLHRLAIRRWHTHPFLVSLATAAAVLLATFAWQQSQPPPTVQTVATAWGWDREDSLNESLSRREYLQSLANAAGEWFNKRPATRREVANRLIQFRQGCSHLILAEHKPLPTADRQWLIGKCRSWAGTLDGHLTALEGGDDVISVRGEIDVTINKLIHAIRTRAAATG
jgi:hypothetical protein